jgi:hypothetical protein
MPDVGTPWDRHLDRSQRHSQPRRKTLMLKPKMMLKQNLKAAFRHHERASHYRHHDMCF